MQERAVETRQRILREATRLFSAQGYDSAGVAEICAASEVSKGAFYHHFPSKQALFLELLQEWLGGLDSEMGRDLDEAPDVPSALNRMASRMKGVFSAADGRVHLFLEFWQQARRDGGVWKEFIAPYRRYQQFFSAILQRGIDEGSLRRVDAQAAGRALVALAVGMVVQGVVDPKAAAWDKATRDAVGLFVDGLRAEGAPRGR